MSEAIAAIEASLPPCQRGCTHRLRVPVVLACPLPSAESCDEGKTDEIQDGHINDFPKRTLLLEVNVQHRGVPRAAGNIGFWRQSAAKIDPNCSKSFFPVDVTFFQSLLLPSGHVSVAFARWQRKVSSEQCFVAVFVFMAVGNSQSWRKIGLINDMVLLLNGITASPQSEEDDQKRVRLIIPLEGFSSHTWRQASLSR